MKLKWQIYILSTLIFTLCAIAFGLLHYDMRLEQSKLAYENKISALLISLGSFAKSDESFISQENLLALKNRAELETLDISKMQAKHKVVLVQNPEIIESNLKLNARYTTGDFILSASLIEQDSIDIQESFIYIIAYWILVGLSLGFLSGCIIFNFLSKKIRLLENKLFDDTKSKIEILELKDLMFSARLLKELNHIKEKREYHKLQDKENTLCLDRIIAEKLSTNKDTKIGKFKISVAIANAKPNNAFYAKISENSILYGKINTKLSDIDALSKSILIRDYAKKLLENMTEQETYQEISKLFDIENFNIIKAKNDSILHLSFSNDSCKEESLKIDGAILLSTQNDHKELALYTKLNFENKENKLNFILKLLPEKSGGLYILIEA